ncbi:hypothetical protein F5Y18DRAFT_330619 [Xylariaceae sp. FL1019]|nr:hypothetical protein F5Y18DRAFT_330619 [Xylariaceae sp. FL1019]
MSTSRAMRPLLGAASRLIVDQLLPRSARNPQRKLFSHYSGTSTAAVRPPKTICWSCRHDYHAAKRQQVRLSSTSKPPDDKKPSASTTGRDDPLTPHSIPLGPPSPSQEAEAQTPPQPPPSTPDPPPDLPSEQNSRRSALNKSLSQFMDRAQNTLFAASQRINDLTGYSGIESLNSQISTLESQLRAAQAHLTATRAAYKNAVAARSATQREVTTLLARQKTWTPVDFDRFTTLYKEDYELEASVGTSATELEKAEREAERLNRDLGAGILGRYHEEQIWSDKIRRMSTWGTWGLMGVNFLLFLLLQFGAEPWRRRRLVNAFEDKVRQALAEERAAREEFESAAAAPAPVATISSVEAPEVEKEAAITEDEEPVVMVVPEVIVPESESEPEAASPASLSDSATIPPVQNSSPPVDWREFITDPQRWRAFVLDLASDRLVALRMRDVSLIVLEGVAAGVAVAGTIAILFLRGSR